MKLSQLNDELEKTFENERMEATKSVIEVISSCLNVNLYEAAKTDNPIDTFNNMCYFLLDKFKDVLYYALEKTNIGIETFQREALSSFILSVTRYRSNVEFLKELLKKRGLILEYHNGKEVLMSTVFGDIKFSLFDQEQDSETKKFIEENEDIKSSCHESTLFLLKENPEYRAVTGIARKNLNGRYLHSFILDGETVIDLTGNLRMRKTDYYLLYGIEEIRNVNYQEFLRDNEECECYDESGTLFPLLRNALYWYSKKDLRK